MKTFIRKIITITCFTLALVNIQASQNSDDFSSHELQNDAIPKPNIVVSIEPLYEVVASLSHGVVRPDVVYLNFNDISKPLSSMQRQLIDNADIIIRVGRGFEPLLDEYLEQQGDRLKNKTITLSQYIPVLDKQNFQALKQEQIKFIDRQANSDLRFWMDPRLVKMLVSFIGPRLVYMDPEHHENYLDNEIVLKAQLKKVEQKMVQLFRTLSMEQKFLLAQFNPYLKNRYMSFAEIKQMGGQLTPQPGVVSCIQNHSFKNIPLNLEYTEKALNSLMHTLMLCSKANVVSR